MARMPRILVTEKIAEGGLDRLRAAGHDVDVQLGATPQQLLDLVRTQLLAPLRVSVDPPTQLRVCDQVQEVIDAVVSALFTVWDVAGEDAGLAL